MTNTDGDPRCKCCGQDESKTAENEKISILLNWRRLGVNAIRSCNDMSPIKRRKPTINPAFDCDKHFNTDGNINNERCKESAINKPISSLSQRQMKKQIQVKIATHPSSFCTMRSATNNFLTKKKREHELLRKRATLPSRSSRMAMTTSLPSHHSSTIMQKEEIKRMEQYIGSTTFNYKRRRMKIEYNSTHCGDDDGDHSSKSPSVARPEASTSKKIVPKRRNIIHKKPKGKRSWFLHSLPEYPDEFYVESCFSPKTYSNIDCYKERREESVTAAKVRETNHKNMLKCNQKFEVKSMSEDFSSREQILMEESKRSDCTVFVPFGGADESHNYYMCHQTNSGPIKKEMPSITLASYEPLPHQTPNEIDSPNKTNHRVFMYPKARELNLYC